MLSIEGAGVRFGETRAVDDVSLDLPDGQVLAVVGPSGCGKSTLLRAVAGLEPLAAGRVTLVNGRIGISGNVLFALNSDQLQPAGSDLLKTLAVPLATYLKTRDEILMTSGFADDQQVHAGNRQFADNWELSAKRALTVTRALIDAGVPASSVFAAAFGSEQPVSSNADDEGRAKNRRVEIAPVPRKTASNGGRAK